MVKITLTYPQLIIATAIIVIAGIFLYTNNQTDSPENRTFDLVLKDRTYVPDTIYVSQGETIHLRIDNQDNELHGLHVPEFGIDEDIDPLSHVSFYFTANKIGSTTASCMTSDHPEKLTIIAS